MGRINDDNVNQGGALTTRALDGTDVAIGSIGGGAVTVSYPAADRARTLVLDVYVWVRASCAVAHRDYSSLHACKEEEEERCLFLEREW